jgi:hypothetical protein
LAVKSPVLAGLGGSKLSHEVGTTDHPKLATIPDACLDSNHPGRRPVHLQTLQQAAARGCQRLTTDWHRVVEGDDL